GSSNTINSNNYADNYENDQSGKEEGEVIDIWQLMINTKSRVRKKFNEVSNCNSVVENLAACQYTRFRVNLRYVQSCLDECTAVKASEYAAAACWRSQTKHACDSIQSWAWSYLNLGISAFSS
ncbi:hypothetical protein GcC1_077019, partial [Golovinomyces cichoracearum]